MNGRQTLMLEGVRQSGLVAGTLLMLGLVAWLARILFSYNHGSLSYLNAVYGLGIILTGSILTGPAPLLATFFDITDKQVLILIFLLTPFYWTFLGVFSGFLRSNPLDERACDSLSRQEKKHLRWAIECIALALALSFSPLSPVSLGRGLLISNGHGSSRYAIINNLRNIDAAKRQFASDKKVPMDYIPTEADLIPYLRPPDGKLPHVGPEHYILNPISESPYAILDKDWRIRRRGLQEGHTITNGTTYRLSN